MKTGLMALLAISLASPALADNSAQDLVVFMGALSQRTWSGKGFRTKYNENGERETFKVEVELEVNRENDSWRLERVTMVNGTFQEFASTGYSWGALGLIVDDYSFNEPVSGVELTAERLLYRYWHSMTGTNLVFLTVESLERVGASKLVVGRSVYVGERLMEEEYSELQ